MRRLKSRLAALLLSLPAGGLLAGDLTGRDWK